MNKNSQPLVSIVMPVYNAGEYLVEAIESIFSQNYSNWELIAVDDASKDNSYKILQSYAKNDSRIKIYRNKENKGVSATASFALTKVQGKYVARMDADDVSVPNRISTQVEFLESNPDVVILGGQCELINKQGESIGYKTFPTNSNDIYKMMFVSIPLQQPSTMVNKSLLPKDFVWYKKGLNVAEDVDLLFRLFKYGKVVNLPGILLKYRIHGLNISLKNPKRTFYLTFLTRMRGMLKYDYVPTIKGVVVTLLQLGLITVLPERWIYPFYAFVRNMRPGKNQSGSFQESSLAVNPVSA